MSKKERLPEDWDPRDALKAQGIFDGLKKVAPSIAFRVEWEVDRYHTWDGDGEDPRLEGYIPYDVDVYASAIVDGELVEERESLGGVYDKPGEEDEDVHGYLPQMIRGALEELGEQLKGPVKKEAEAARAHVKEISRRLYEIQRKDIARGKYGS